jgi:uncharacterized metal-binding protein YceD (DUF177 family)
MAISPQHRPGTREPWSAPLRVTQVPAEGLSIDIAASEPQAAAVAETGQVRHVRNLRTEVRLTHERGGRIRVSGRVSAVVGQTCVVTLEPIDSTIDEPIDLLFAPPEMIPQTPTSDGDHETGSTPDLPEPIVDGQIDLGRLATDALFLAIDPYPRKPGAVFEPVNEEDDPQAHPFAALQALKDRT